MNTKTQNCFCTEIANMFTRVALSAEVIYKCKLSPEIVSQTN